MNLRGNVSWVLSFFLTLLLFPTTIFSQSQEDLILAAKTERKVVWYSSLNLVDLKRLANAFEKKYPFLKVEPYRASGERISNKILTEVRAEKYLFDLVAVGAFEIWPLYKRGLLGRYYSPESKIYNPAFKDPEGRWINLYNNYYVVGYNTKIVPLRDVPRSWDDMLDPKWKNNFAIDYEDYEWYIGMLSSMGEEQGRNFMRRLAQQNIQWRKGHTLIAQEMVAGAFPAALVYAHRAESMKSLGAPIDWSPTFNPIVSGMRVASISVRPLHPNAAKLLYNYVISKEGQYLIRSFHRIPAHPAVKPLTPRMDPKMLRVFPVQPHMAERANHWIREFREIFQLR